VKHKALIIESTRLFQGIIEKIFHNVGVECRIYTSGKAALESHHDDYAFILVARTLKDISGEIFLQRYSMQHGLGDEKTILLTSADVNDVKDEAIQAGFNLILDKKNIGTLQDVIIKSLNERVLEVESNILYVEDSQSIADFTISLLQESNANVHHESRIDDMQKIFTAKIFDLVITDYYLHDGETGDQVISFIRNFDDSEKFHTPILVVSGEMNQTKRTSFLRNGANDYIVKPYDNDELLVRSSNLIKYHRLFVKSRDQQKQLTKLALTDHLTGLYNRHSLYDIGPKYISNSLRHGDPLSILVIDLDHFKNVNDTHGHTVGDHVLKSVAESMKSQCRTEDIVARFGGEEFIMLLTRCDLNSAMQKAEILRAVIEKSKPEGLIVTSSIGVAQLLPGEGFSALFDRADKAVYDAKDTGRNKVVSWCIAA